jgi:hypothetical protein
VDHGNVRVKATRSEVLRVASEVTKLHPLPPEAERQLEEYLTTAPRVARGATRVWAGPGLTCMCPMRAVFGDDWTDYEKWAHEWDRETRYAFRSMLATIIEIEEG